jgi:hypothetical protein
LVEAEGSEADVCLAGIGVEWEVEMAPTKKNKEQRHKAAAT